MDKQLYIKADDCPLELDFWENIPTYKFKNIDYVKVDVCKYVGDWKKMSIVDIELSEQPINEQAGEFNGFGTTPAKDFAPCCTELLEVFENEKLRG